VIDVATLRAHAHARASARAPIPFAGHVRDGRIAEVPIRRYRPDSLRPGAATVIFLHGGYGIFGDLQLQDGWCRRLAGGLGHEVVAVDYRLAPEHTFAESLADVVAVADWLTGADERADGSAPTVVLCGDSAGGALALAAARQLGPKAEGLLLTNPNLDLTLASFDPEQPDGPDLATLRFAIGAWFAVDDLVRAPRLHLSAAGLPATLIAVGSRDALVGEATSLAHHLRLAGVHGELLNLAETGHGFVSDAAAAEQVIAAAVAFFATTETSRG